MFKFLKLKFYSAVAAGWVSEYKRVVVWPRSPCKLRGDGWAGNMVVHYLRDLLKILVQKGELKKRFYGKGPTPGWYPPEMDWTEFGRVSTSGTQEQKTRI